MAFIKKIGGALKKIGSFAKKAVGFANKILNGPLGKLASFIPGVGPFIAGAAKIVGIADSVLNGGGGFKGIIGGLVQNFAGNLGGGLLAKAGTLLSKTGLDTVIGLGSKAGSSGQIFDMVKTLMAPRQGDQSPAAQGDKYNLSQFAAFQLAQLTRQQQAAE